MVNKQRAVQIFSKLQELYPNVEATLENWDGVYWKFLFAVMMSAQTTDKQVNSVTKLLFRKYPTLEEFANAELKELEQSIHPVGFHRTKARNLKKSAEILLKSFNGEVPLEMKALESLPGVGRKTANVVTGVLLEENFGIAVDTHVIRLAQRIGLSKHSAPEKIERDLMELFPKESWSKLSLLLIFHGRSICKALKPDCANCALKELCDYSSKNV